MSRLELHRDLDGPVNKTNNFLKVFLDKSTAGHSRGSHTEAMRNQSTLVARHGVLVAVNVAQFQNPLDTSSINPLVSEIDEDQMVFCSTRNQVISTCSQGLSHGRRVLDNLLLVGLELRGGCLLQCNGESADGVVVRTSLQTGENSLVDSLFIVIHDGLSLLVLRLLSLAEEDHGTSRTSERLVGGSGDDVSVLEWIRNNSRCHQSRDVSHVGKEDSINRVGDFPHFGIVVVPSVS
mmetsp:Transcript_9141/g.30474  ORF Transcript_9141/g.30474 Transcript_9141/m.30474 type:complete len:236 (+) Transcript_9141:409-1116(+)